MYIDNFYTSYGLAKKFPDNKTHVVGTIQATRKKFPEEVMNKKLKRGEMEVKEEENGIIALKWKDKRDVRVLSTKHTPNMLEPPPKRRSASTQDNVEEPTQSNKPIKKRKKVKNIKKPEAILAYNKGKAGINILD